MPGSAIDPARVRFVDVGGIRTRCFEDGAGEPLVLIHGGEFGFLCSLECWSLNVPRLAQHFRVIAFDTLGQGHTDNPRRDGDYAMRSLIDHALGVLDVLGVGPAHLVGHSRGGFLATCLAFDNPSGVRSLTVVDSSTTAADDPKFPLGVFYQELERRRPPGPPTRASVRLEADAQSFSLDHVTDDFVDGMLAIARSEKCQAAQRWMREHSSGWLASLHARRREVLARIDADGLPVPTLVVWGCNDPSAPLPLGLDLYARICARTPHAELHVLNQAGHYSFREQPHKFNRLIDSFCLDIQQRQEREAVPSGGGSR